MNVHSKFIQYQRINFDFDDEHKNNDFEMILHDKCKINDINNEFNYSIIEFINEFRS